MHVSFARVFATLLVLAATALWFTHYDAYWQVVFIVLFQQYLLWCAWKIFTVTRGSTAATRSPLMPDLTAGDARR